MVREKKVETPTAATLVLDVPEWPGHRAGQHLDVRLTAPDGYQATRSYSLASAPGEAPAITVERADGGEVSPFLVDVAVSGTALEARGPIGGYFVWEPGHADVVTLLAGGSGIVPLRSMLRHRRKTGDSARFSVLYSTKSVDRIIYRTELEETTPGEKVTFTLTGSDPPADWDGERGRVTPSMISRCVHPPTESAIAYVCGPTAFVEAAASMLTDAGYRSPAVRTE